MKVSEFKWHQLDPEVGGYMTCHVGEGFDLIILSTPIVLSEKEAEEILREKLNQTIK